jgi:hypothetical protein
MMNRLPVWFLSVGHCIVCSVFTCLVSCGQQKETKQANTEQTIQWPTERNKTLNRQYSGQKKETKQANTEQTIQWPKERTLNRQYSGQKKPNRQTLNRQSVLSVQCSFFWPLYCLFSVCLFGFFWALYFLFSFFSVGRCIVCSGLSCLVVFNATFNNISVISWRSVLLVEETGVPGENHQPVSNY